jgi:purine nucleoside phosphorylase
LRDYDCECASAVGVFLDGPSYKTPCEQRVARLIARDLLERCARGFIARHLQCVLS